MISFTQLGSMFTDLTQNTASTNLTRANQWFNIEHRYLLQKYFSNEASFSTTTIGQQSLTLTGGASANAVSATLTAVWSYPNTLGYATFSNGDARYINLTTGSVSINWTGGLSSSTTTAITVGIQYYPLPPNYSKLKTLTISNGNLTWTPTPILTREDWDKLNVFPYYASIPANYFLYPGGDRSVKAGIWPIPSTTGNLITYNYKFRVPDLSIADYTTPGTVSITSGSTTVTGTATSFVATVNTGLESRWIQFSSPTGDNLWYQILSVDSTTQITLYTPYQGSTITNSSTYTIGQMPLLMEDFHDMLLWKALTYYFSTIVPNKEKHDEHLANYDTKLALLNDYATNKTLNVDLGRRAQGLNPNLFPQTIG